MNVDEVMSFIISTRSVLEAELRLDVTVGRPTAEGDEFAGDFSGIIEFEGEVAGTMVLVFPASTGHAILGRLESPRPEFQEFDVAEVLGSLLAAIKTEVESRLAARDVRVARPSMVLGHGHRFRPVKGSACVSIPVHCDLGRVRLELAFEPAAVPAC